MIELHSSTGSCSTLGTNHVDERGHIGRNWVLVIENTLSRPFPNNNIEKVKSITHNIFCSSSLPILAMNFARFYKELSKNEVTGYEELQQELVFYTLSIERKRFLLDPAPNLGGTRIFSQIAFLNFLSSSLGNDVINSLASIMSLAEKKIFTEAICTLTALTPNYIELLSYIEAKSYLDRENENPRKHLDLTHILSETFRKDSKILVPLGWELSTPLMSHHMFFYMQKDLENPSKAIFQIIDTLIDPENTATLDSPFISRGCGLEYTTNKIEATIQKIASLILLQNPKHAEEYIKKSGMDLTENVYPHLLKLNYGLTYNTEEIECTDPTPLSNWNWIAGNTCAFSTFQPLLQILAFKVEGVRNLTLSEQSNIKHYFELIMHSYKLSLLDKFSVFNPHIYRAAVHSSIKESGSAILALPENKIGFH